LQYSRRDLYYNKLSIELEDACKKIVEIDRDVLRSRFQDVLDFDSTI
jgi:hypothetical protein